MTATIDTTILSPLWDTLDFDAAAEAGHTVRLALGIATEEEALEVSIALTDDTTVRALNKKYRGKDKSTNVLSFPATGEGEFQAPGTQQHLGDIIIAFETMMAEAKAMNVTPADHLTHLLVHGVLHLLGYDHEQEKDAEEMEDLEVKILGEIGIKNPYLNAKFVA